ncbi:hypothetical protein PISMIDRAFT_570093 [Pisolithus microcarpus 441]|uniref:Uncharacterized protein n=1 Tax=Pisolithus microcarpus 441 TaxID=765257 RepID=A0A0C9YS36_9AGAM|nr:hypothetical protein BKA83DRAFT_570093 [Pisolithus microcarpus]KIK10813.1 hypothetical protein PISMIDRAFT_570093 [Pisolithus microcarpus 441]
MCSPPFLQSYSAVPSQRPLRESLTNMHSKSSGINATSRPSCSILVARRNREDSTPKIIHHTLAQVFGIASLTFVGILDVFMSSSLSMLVLTPLHRFSHCYAPHSVPLVDHDSLLPPTPFLSLLTGSPR